VTGRFRDGVSRIHQVLVGFLEGFRDFRHLEVSGSIVLLLATVSALLLANSAFGHSFEAFWHLEFGIHVGDFAIAQSLKHWIDDGLMAVFFFVVGLEIKREILVGELSSLRKAALPIIAAVGGMVVPAIIYTLVNHGGQGAHGWGIPMATDIAFALGVLAVLGSRVPTSLKVFLTALAIADDLGAVLIIAIFYTSEILWGWLGVAVLLLVLLVLFNLMGVRSPMPYFLVASVIWFAFLNSGVHATIAGVLVALTIPARARREPLEFVEWTRLKLDKIQELEVLGAHVLDSDAQQVCAMEIRTEAIDMQAPLQRLEYGLHPVTTFVILPLFALANAGIVFGGANPLEILMQPVALGVMLGLLVGKQLGVTLFAWLAVRAGLASLPAGVRWRHVYGAGWLAGIGFTMSLFVSGLAFEDTALQAEAKLAILVTSLLAGMGGYLFLRATSKTTDAAVAEIAEVAVESAT